MPCCSMNIGENEQTREWLCTALRSGSEPDGPGVALRPAACHAPHPDHPIGRFRYIA
jgi:hypothetical protein